jgi:serine/threonine-protein kinase RsbW
MTPCQMGCTPGCGMQVNLMRRSDPPPPPGQGVGPGLAIAPRHPQRAGPPLHITLPGEAEAVRRALQDLRTSPILQDTCDDLCSTVEIILAEVLNNIVEHAYARLSGQITISIHHHPQSLWFEVTDTGEAMPGLSLPPGHLPAMGAVDDLPEGGFGWFLIRSLTTELRYRRIGATNRLSFRISAQQSDA